MKTTDLTQEEINLILEYREKQKKRARERKNRLHILDIAKKYEEWLQDNRMGSTFTVFIDGFGFSSPIATDVFRHVEEIRRNCAFAEVLDLADNWMEYLK